MSDEGLYRLYKLHQVDARLIELQARAASLDKGQEEASEFKRIATESEPLRKDADSKKLNLTDVENRLASNRDKLAKFQKQLYDGSVTHPREIENIQKEVEQLEGLVTKGEGDIERLRPDADTAQEIVEEIKSQLRTLKKQVGKKQEKAKEAHQLLQEEYKQAAAKRKPLLEGIDPALIRAYEAARKKTGSTGMATVTSGGSCSACGVPVAERTMTMVRSGKATPCEGCGRLLFIVLPEEAS